MDEQTSESVVEESIDLFADEEPEVEQTSEAEDDTFAEETQPEEEEAPAEPDGQQSDAGAENILDIVYNGQAMSLNRQQAIEMAQKGMNYDKLQQRLQAAENSPERQMIARLAQQSGMDVNSFMQSLEQQLSEYQVNTRAEQLLSDSYMDRDTAMRLARSEIEKEALQNEKAAQERAQQEYLNKQQAQAMENQRKRDTFTKEIQELVNTYPDFQSKYPTIESMPKVMQDAIRNGESIKSAYQQVIIDELRSENAAYKQNQKNAIASTGSATGTGATNAKDPFLSALYSDD